MMIPETIDEDGEYRLPKKKSPIKKGAVGSSMGLGSNNLEP